MMQEEQVKKYWFMSRCGAYSVKKNTRDVVYSLKYSREVLKNPANLVCLFPQGEIESQHAKKVHFQKGAEWLLHNLGDSVHVFFCVALTDYHSSPKPLIRLYVKEFRDIDASKLEPAYNLFRNECIKKQES